MQRQKSTSRKKGTGSSSELTGTRAQLRQLRTQHTKATNRAAQLKKDIDRLSKSKNPTDARITKLREELEKKESAIVSFKKDIESLTSKIERIEGPAEPKGHDEAPLSTSKTPASSLDTETSEITDNGKRGRPDAEDSDIISKRPRTTWTNDAMTPIESVQYEDSPSLRLPDDVATTTYSFDVSMIGTYAAQYNDYNFADPQTQYHPQFFGYGPDNLPTRGLASLAWPDEQTPSTLSRASSNVGSDPTQALSNGYQTDSCRHPAYIADYGNSRYVPPRTEFVHTSQPSNGSESSRTGGDTIQSSSPPSYPTPIGTSYLGYEIAPTASPASQSSAENHIAFGPLAPSMSFNSGPPISEAVLPANRPSALTTQLQDCQPAVTDISGLGLGAGPLYSLTHDHFPDADKRQDAGQESAIVDKVSDADSNSVMTGRKLTLEEVKERLKVFEDHPQYPWLNDPTDSWSMAIDLGCSKNGKKQGLPTTVSGIPLRALMEQLLRSPDVKANPDGSLPLSLLLERGIEYWKEAIRLDKKANEKQYIQKPGQSILAYNTEMAVAFHDTCKAFIRAGGNPNEVTFAYKLREWVRKDARHGRLAGLLSVEFALLALTTSNGLLKCIYHHHSGKDFSKQDLNACDNYNNILDKRDAIQKERQAILAFVTGQQGVDDIAGEKSVDGGQHGEDGEDGEGGDEGEDEEEDGKKKKEKKLKMPALPTSLITGTPEQAIRPRKDKKDADAQANADSEMQPTKTKGKGQPKSSKDAKPKAQPKPQAQRKEGYGDCGCPLEDLLSGFKLWKSQSVYSPTLEYHETYATNQLQPLPRTFLLDALNRHLGLKLTECYGYILVEKKPETIYRDSEWVYVENRPEWILSKAIDRLTMARDEIAGARLESETVQGLLDEAEDNRPLDV